VTNDHGVYTMPDIIRRIMAEMIVSLTMRPFLRIFGIVVVLLIDYVA
jgi:hypothetical protein